MLRYRILTAAVLIPLVFAGLFLTTSVWFSILCGVLVLLGAWEWPVMLGLKTRLARFSYVFGISILLVSLFVGHPGLYPVGYWFAVITLGWLLILLWVIRYPLSAATWSNSVVLVLLGGFILLPLWLSLTWLRGFPMWKELIILLLLFVWGADTGAYFIGRLLGKAKLLAEVSPGKTWAGFWGGMLTVLVIAKFYYDYTDLFALWWQPYVLGVLTFFAAVLGDLAESMFKRNQEIKDSGTMLPGHGGILDRIDSLTAAAPIFAFIWWLFLPTLG